MKKSAKRLDRRSFWMWAVPLGLGHLVVYIAIVRGAGQLWWLDVILLMLLAIALVRRFRDIGWPGWIGPTILLVTVIGLPHQFFDPVASFVLRYAIANHVGPQAMQL